MVDRDAAVDTLVSFTADPALDVQSHWRTNSFPVIVRDSFFQTPKTDDLEIHQWLDEAGTLQDKLSELDRTLNSLAEEQANQSVDPQAIQLPS